MDYRTQNLVAVAFAFGAILLLSVPAVASCPQWPTPGAIGEFLGNANISDEEKTLFLRQLFTARSACQTTSEFCAGMVPGDRLGRILANPDFGAGLKVEFLVERYTSEVTCLDKAEFCRSGYSAQQVGAILANPELGGGGVGREVVREYTDRQAKCR
jgi:hypothetical protein